jgi:hypothetical protein
MTKFNRHISRRDALQSLAAGTTLPLLPQFLFGREPAGSQPLEPKRVAGIVSVYQHNSHADVILGKIFDGWEQNGGPGPALKIVSLYVDQFPQRDLARGLAEKHGIPICSSIREALTLGSERLAVDGVLSVGEHGSYPYNEKEQHLYPRRRFFSEIAATMEECEQTVPVFNDKSLSTVWEDAKWVYDRAQQLGIPLMAGSSLPTTFRKPDATLPLGSPIEEVVSIGYGQLCSYGFHAIEMLQTFAERRHGAETGVDWVQTLTGDAMWKAVDSGEVSSRLLDAALAHVPTVKRRKLRELDPKKSALFRIQYRDGVKGAVFMLQGYAAGVAVACRVQGQREPFALQIEERYEPRFPHFAYLLKGVERMVHTGTPSWPVERSLLTGGILDRALTSRIEDSRRIETPELAIRYKPADVSYAPHVSLAADPLR